MGYLPDFGSVFDEQDGITLFCIGCDFGLSIGNDGALETGDVTAGFIVNRETAKDPGRLFIGDSRSGDRKLERVGLGRIDIESLAADESGPAGNIQHAVAIGNEFAFFPVGGFVEPDTNRTKLP